MKMKKGKLFVIDAPDGCGKATQTQLMCDVLKEKGYKVLHLSFPTYGHPSCQFVEQYLNGKFGSNPSDVTAKAASTFYALNRFVTFKEIWEKLYNDGYIIISDRYTTSNMIHQAAKIKDKNERNAFLNWLEDLEYNAYGLPVPTQVFYLNVNPSITSALCANRPNKINQAQQKDIHESDDQFMYTSYTTAMELAEMYQWTTIKCENEEHTAILPIQEIHEKLYAQIEKYL